ncbi:MAG: transposase [Bacteroidales bacterium 36-12]|nr:MAG: transposase [Bacteroidales bacterium 36-12]
MSYIRIWIHAVFSTKYREPLLDKTSRQLLYNHIKELSGQKNIYLDHIGGYVDHVHILLSLGGKQNIADVMQQIKGESSFWINKQGIVQGKFQWQDDYYAASVSQSQVEKVRKYIARQEEHHRKKPFAKEVEEFIQKYGWQYVKDKESMQG